MLTLSGHSQLLELLRPLARSAWLLAPRFHLQSLQGRGGSFCHISLFSHIISSTARKGSPLMGSWRTHLDTPADLPSPDPHLNCIYEVPFFM